MFGAARPMPPEKEAVFGAAEFQARTGATPEQMADLERFRTLLEEWNQRINLVGPSAMQQFWLRHAFDSAQLLELAPNSLRWADLGAGAGLPGVVLAIMLKGRPGVRVNLVESLTKRCRFLEEAVATLELPAVVHNDRAENLTLSVDIVTARACAPLVRLFDYALPYMKKGAVGLFLKGQDVATEVAAARPKWRFDLELIPSLSDPSGRILRVERMSRAR